MPCNIVRGWNQSQAAEHRHLGQGYTTAWQAGGPPRKRPSSSGRFCCAEGKSMRREINRKAGNRLNLDTVALSCADHRVLDAAFERCERLAQAGGSAVAFDTAVEIAAEAGYRGVADREGDILRREGGYIVDPGLSRRLTMRRADSPTP